MAVGIGELRMSLASVDAFVPLENVTRSVSDDDGSSQCIHDVITFTIEPLVTHHLVLQVKTYTLTYCVNSSTFRYLTTRQGHWFWAILSLPVTIILWDFSMVLHTNKTFTQVQTQTF